MRGLRFEGSNRVKMKIAILHWGFPLIIGGVETHLSLLGPELVRRA